MHFSLKSILIPFLLAISFPFFASAQFQVDPSSLTFTVPTVGANVVPQSLSVTATPAAVNFSITSSYAAQGCYALNVGPLNGVTPASITVAINSAGLAAGTYTCSLTISSTQGGFSTVVPVTINVGTGSGTSGNLSVSPGALSLALPNGFSSTSGTLTLANVGSTGSAGFTASTNSIWLTVSPTSGTVASTTSLQVYASASGLSSGVYSGSVIISPSSGAASLVVPVTLTISAGPTVQAKQNGSAISTVNFVYQSSGQLPPSQSFTLLSSDGSSLSCTISQSTAAAYLNISPLGTYYLPQLMSVSLTSAATALSAGSYTTNLAVNCPGATNPTLTIPINLVVSSSPLLSLGTPPSTFSYQVGGASPTSQVVQLSSTSSQVQYTTNISYANGNGWLNVTPTIGSTSAANPTSLIVNVDPTTLASGTYTATVFIYSTNAANSPISFPVTLVVSGTTSNLTAIPTALTFNYQIGQTLPPSQSIAVSSSGTPQNYYVTTSSQTCPGFFSVSPNSSATPSSVTVSIVATGFSAAQVCSGSVTVTSSAGGGTINIPVTMNVSTSPVLQINPASLTFSGVLASGSSSSQTVNLTSSDSTSAISYTAYSAASWVTVSPTTGSAPSQLVVMVNPNGTGLKAGLNTTTVTIFSALSSVSLTISYNLTTGGGAAAASPTSLAFTQAVGGTAPAAQAVSISLSGGLSTATYSVNVITGGTTGWLTVNPINGTAPGAFTVAANGNSLPAGSYTATLQVTVPGAANSPVSIPVTLTVTQPATLAITPQSLSFTAAAGGQNPANQSFQVTSSGNPITFTYSSSSSSCGNFFSVSATGTTTPASLVVAVNTAGLSAGTCTGSIVITGNGGNSQTLPVSLTITAPAPVVTSITNAASYATGSVAPGEIVTIFGSNLGPSTLTLGSFSNGKFSTSVAGTQVQFDTGAYAPVIYARNDQVSVVVPFEVNGRVQTNIQVTYNGQVSATLQQRVVDTAPGIFTSGSTGVGQGSIVNQSGTVNSASAPATKGSVVAVYITGAGQTDPVGSTGSPGNLSPLQNVKASVSATIGAAPGTAGAIPATVWFSGAAPTYIQGLYQVNVQIPDTANSGNQQLFLTIGGVQTQTGVTINIQ